MITRDGSAACMMRYRVTQMAAVRGLYKFFSVFTPLLVFICCISVSDKVIFSPEKEKFCPDPAFLGFRGLDKIFVDLDPYSPVIYVISLTRRSDLGTFSSLFFYRPQVCVSRGRGIRLGRCDRGQKVAYSYFLQDKKQHIVY